MENEASTSRKRRGAGRPSGTGTKRKRKKKTPLVRRPKQPFNAWKIFFRDTRPWVVQKLREKGQDIKPGFVMKAVGKLWKSLHPSAKIVYSKQAAELSKQYQKDIGVWKRKKHKGTGRPPTAFVMFRADKQEEILESEEFKQLPNRAKSKYQLVAKKLGSMWRALDPAKKQPYLDRYEEAMKVYRAQRVAEEGRQEENKATNDEEEFDEAEAYDTFNFSMSSPVRPGTPDNFGTFRPFQQSPNDSLVSNKNRTPIRIRRKDFNITPGERNEFEMSLESLFDGDDIKDDCESITI